ncbi:MAG TPA: Rne/Rng family ribonuclease [Pyrinomonadaceae bacterium]|nr:Rne/Rng family ribonuclease [Pyrinomonadaceae bacterium]
MSKEMIVSVNGREKKIAILDNGRVTEFYIERGEENSGVVGNVYKGRVMRVLPGMQSAFVDIGLERDAFLYVSDFFDEEEEIERIVMEKGKKQSPEEAKREANDRIDRSRIEREKQMEAVQEIVEPLSETGALYAEGETDDPMVDATQDEEPRQDPAESPVDYVKPDKAKRARGRGKKEKIEEPPAEQATTEPTFQIEYDNFGFERISDDSDTGELFKDAYMQEAIIDRVRAVEFDMETTSAAEVGSLLAEVGGESSGFERIADDDEDPVTSGKARGRKKAAETGEKAPARRKSPAKRGSVAKGKFSKTSRKKTASDTTSDEGGSDLSDTEANHRESDSPAGMAVRRGGRGRRRGGKGREDGGEENGDNQETGVSVDVVGEDVADMIEPENGHNMGAGHADPVQAAGEPESSDEPVRAADDRQRPDGRDNRDRGRRGARGRNDRPDRPGNDGKRFDRNDRGDRRDRPAQLTISDLLREGQEILVQIAKEPIAKKGARITSHIALPGRFLVYMPTIEHLGVSRKIESASERSRLRTLIQRIRQDKEIPSGGFIVRTAGVGIAEEDLRNDAKYLARMWMESKKGSEKKKSPALVHQDLDLVQRILRDQLADDFTAIRVDSEEEYLRTVEFINLIQPRSVNRIKLYTRDEPILDYYGVQEEIDKALKPRVWLKSGGYLVINQTEALVAIDVNTGKFVGKGNARLEDTITKTNMEAVDEIARQIRLRDLGGIIVLDLIDMEDRRNRHKVSQALQEALHSDRSPTKVLSFNDFGLIIMTRKRVKQSLERTMCTPCEYCDAAGWVKSPTTVCYEILAEARRLSKSVEDVRRTTIRVHPDVAVALRNSEREVLDEIEAYLGHLDISSDKAVHPGQFDFAFV